MKINYSDYIKKLEVSVLVAEAIFSELVQRFPTKMISEIAETTSGGTPLRNNHEYYNGDIPWLKSGELNDSYIESSEEFITEKGLKNSSAKLLPEGTLLLAMYGATVGKTGITKIKATTNQAICAIFPKGEISQEFLFWFLKQYRYKFINISKGGAQPNISQSVINDTRIPIPNKTVQDQVVSVLDSIQKTEKLDLSYLPEEYKGKIVKIFNTKNSATTLESEITCQLDLLKKLRQQILQDAVQGRLVLQDPDDEPASELLKKIKAEKEQLMREKKIRQEKPLPAVKKEEMPFEIPENWVWCRLSEICTKITDGTHHSPQNLVSGDVKYITAKNIKDAGIDLNNITFISKDWHDEIFSRCNPEYGDLLFIKDGATTGIVTINNLHEPFSLLSSVALLKLPNNILNKFLMYSIRSPFFYNATRNDMFGVAITRVTLEKIQNAIIPVPPLREQHRIVIKVDQFMTLCDELEQTIRQNQNYTRQLLQMALKEALEPGS